MDQSTNTDDASKTKNQWKNNHDIKSLKAVATNTYTKSQDADISKSVFSYLTFKVTAAPAKVQAHYASATTGTAITEDPTIKGILLPPLLG